MWEQLSDMTAADWQIAWIVRIRQFSLWLCMGQMVTHTTCTQTTHTHKQFDKNRMKGNIKSLWKPAGFCFLCKLANTLFYFIFVFIFLSLIPPSFPKMVPVGEHTTKSNAFLCALLAFGGKYYWFSLSIIILICFFVYWTLDVNTVLLKLLKRHKLYPSDSKCLSQKRQNEREREWKMQWQRDRGREMERETSSIKIQKIITLATPPPCWESVMFNSL